MRPRESGGCYGDGDSDEVRRVRWEFDRTGRDDWSPVLFPDDVTATGHGTVPAADGTINQRYSQDSRMRIE